MANLADLVQRAAKSVPTKPAFVAGARSLTWSEFDALVDRLAGGLVAEGLAPGDRVGLLLPNSIEFAASYFAALRAGLVAVPLNNSYTQAEVDYQVSDSGARLVLKEADCARLADHAPYDGKARSGDEDLAVLLYTSGTTGRPKGAMLTHRALLANLDQLREMDPPVVAPDDVVLLVVPLFHVYGLNTGLALTAAVAATGVLGERFDPVETLTLVREKSVTTIIGAPPMYVAWSMLPDLRDALKTVRIAVSGAAPLPAEVFSSVLSATGKQVYEGYGLTETAPVLTTTLCSKAAKPGSIGRPIPGVDLRLTDDTGDDVEDDDPGEIVVRGPNLFSGYWPDGAGGPDANGWFHTGDVAYADADGDLFLVDRIRELILVSGFNVYPREVEDVITTHPDVAEAAVIGVPHPYTGETVRALVVPREGKQIDPDDVIGHVAGRLARFKCPTSIEIVDELPHSATGKVAKGKLRSG
jgi:long-chain acyl-CoA synthetase